MVCQRCGDVIGVYEPLVLQTPSGRQETSLAADPLSFRAFVPAFTAAAMS